VSESAAAAAKTDPVAARDSCPPSADRFEAVALDVLTDDLLDMDGRHEADPAPIGGRR
jgi:hypothetical protein